MKYRLLKDLPFASAGNVFSRGSWTGWGVDRGTTKFSGGGSAHNGVTTFSDLENNLITSIINRPDWMQKIPSNKYDWLDLYDAGEIGREELVKGLCEK